MKHSKGKPAYVLILRRRTFVALMFTVGYGTVSLVVDLAGLVF